MAIIANAEVHSLAEPWSGEIRTGTHSLMTDKPESFGGKIKVLHPMTLFVQAWFLVL